MMFPKKTICATDRVRFTRPRARFSETGTAIGPADTVGGEILGDVIEIRPDSGGKPVHVPREKVETIVDRTRGANEPPPPPPRPYSTLRRRTPLRSKPRARWSPRPATSPGCPLLRQDLLISRRMPAGLKAIAKPAPPVRWPAFRVFVRRWPCCNPYCRKAPPSEIHHSGEQGVGQTSGDLSGVPLCRACHAHVTAHNVLPSPSGLPEMGRMESDLVIARANADVNRAWSIALRGLLIMPAPSLDGLSEADRRYLAELDSDGVEGWADA